MKLLDENEKVAFLRQQLQLLESQKSNIQSQQAISMFQNEDDTKKNVMELVLNSDKILERIETFLRQLTPQADGKGGHIMVPPFKEIVCKVIRDEDGIEYSESIGDNLIYSIKYMNETQESIIANPIDNRNNQFLLTKQRQILGTRIIKVRDPEAIVLNETGIHEILSQLAWYINPDIILSNYNEDEVKIIVLNFGIEFSDFLHINMERFGMDTRKKQRYYNMLCTNVINIVDATYHRSIGGKALDALNKSVMVTQSEPLMQGMNMNMGFATKKHFNVLKPSTWKG